jgi:hypothetical protein
LACIDKTRWLTCRNDAQKVGLITDDLGAEPDDYRVVHVLCGVAGPRPRDHED